MYDLILKGGRVVDAASGLDGVLDVAVDKGAIARIAAGIAPTEAARVLDVSGKLVTPGLIDLHAHVFEGVNRTGVNPDLGGVHAGDARTQPQVDPALGVLLDRAQDDLRLRGAPLEVRRQGDAVVEGVGLVADQGDVAGRVVLAQRLAAGGPGHAVTHDDVPSGTYSHACPPRERPPARARGTPPADATHRP